MAIQECKRADKFVPRDSLILCVGCREVRACYQARTKRREKQTAREDEGFQRRMLRDPTVVREWNRSGVPVPWVWREDGAAIWK
jgi:hypothetical protein